MTPPPDAADGMPLSALASQVWVAFTIECDNEFERQMPHWTTDGARAARARGVRAVRLPGAPWLVSISMWWTCLRYVGEDGVTVRALAERARAGTHLAGLERWGYVRIGPDPGDTRTRVPRGDWVIRATSAGRAARYVFEPLVGVIEARWRERFGGDEIDRLDGALRALVRQLDPALPDGLPVLGYGLVTEIPETAAGVDVADEVAALSLPALCARLLVAWALEFERASGVALAISANVMRVLAADGATASGVRVRDLPMASGISTAAIEMALGWLEARDLVVVGPDPAGSRAKVAQLTAAGREAHVAHEALARRIEAGWRERYGESTIAEARRALAALVGSGDASDSPLWRGLAPYPDGWRASVPRPGTLPHFPAVLHRGGYPDGS